MKYTDSIYITPVYNTVNIRKKHKTILLPTPSYLGIDSSTLVIQYYMEENGWYKKAKTLTTVFKNFLNHNSGEGLIENKIYHYYDGILEVNNIPTLVLKGLDTNHQQDILFINKEVLETQDSFYRELMMNVIPSLYDYNRNINIQYFQYKDVKHKNIENDVINTVISQDNMLDLLSNLICN